MTQEEYQRQIAEFRQQFEPLPDPGIAAPKHPLTAAVPLPQPKQPTPEPAPSSPWTTDTSFLERSPVESPVEDDEDPDLSRIQVRAIGLLIQGATVSDVARTCGMSRKQIYEWLKQPAFIASLKRRRDAATAQADLMAQQAATKAVLKLIAKLDDPRSKTADAIRAANSILNYAQASVEREQIVERIDAIERERRSPEAGAYRIVNEDEQAR
jgi:transposase-like protein